MKALVQFPESHCHDVQLRLTLCSRLRFLVKK